MRRLILLLPLLLLTACPSGPSGPANGIDLRDAAEAFTLKADADWADAASAEIIRLGRLTGENVLDLAATKAEGVCRLLAHLDEPGARQVFLMMLDHPDSKSGFYRPFVLAGATIAWVRALQTGQVDSIAPLVERLGNDAREMLDYHWFSLLADAVEAAEARSVLPALVGAAIRLGAASEQARGIVYVRVLQAHLRLNDPTAVTLARSVLDGKPSFETGVALAYLDRHDRDAAIGYAKKILDEGGPTVAALNVLARSGAEWNEVTLARITELPEEKRQYLEWYGKPPAWEPPDAVQQHPAVARFLIANGIGNRPKYLRLWIQPPLSKTTPRWFAEEQNALQQRAALQSLYARPLPSIWGETGRPDPYGVWSVRLSSWWEAEGYQLTWDEKENRYTP